MTIAALSIVAALSASAPLPFAARVDAERAIERTRYTFTLNATRPFDTVYPRAVFERKVARELSEERALELNYHVRVTRAMLDAEYDRIETHTKAPDQWRAIKRALGNDRRLVEEAFCRPIVADRLRMLYSLGSWSPGAGWPSLPRSK